MRTSSRTWPCAPKTTNRLAWPGGRVLQSPHRLCQEGCREGAWAGHWRRHGTQDISQNTLIRRVFGKQPTYERARCEPANDEQVLAELAECGLGSAQ